MRTSAIKVIEIIHLLIPLHNKFRVECWADAQEFQKGSFSLHPRRFDPNFMGLKYDEGE